jgi:hypothetical protein
MTELKRFSIAGIPFNRRPVSQPPADGTLCFADNGNPWGWTDRGPALFKDGRWTTTTGKDLRFVPSYWIVLDV